MFKESSNSDSQREFAFSVSLYKTELHYFEKTVNKSILKERISYLVILRHRMLSFAQLFHSSVLRRKYLTPKNCLCKKEEGEKEREMENSNSENICSFPIIHFK